MSGAAEPRRILVVKTHAIGDVLMATPALRDLRAAHPRARITLLTGTWSEPVVRHNPHVDAVHAFEDEVLLRPRPLAALRLLRALRRERFDMAVVLHPSRALHLFARLAGAPVRCGLTRGGPSPHLTRGVEEDLGPGTYYPVNYQKVAALAGAANGPARPEVFHSPEEGEAARRILDAAGIAVGEPYVLVAPGGGRNSKEDVAARRLPATTFAALLQAVRAVRPDVRFVLTGGPADAAEAAAVAAAVPGIADLSGKTPLGVLVALCRGARAVVCNDSSLLHIAVACGRPAVVAFGPTAAAQRVPPEFLEFTLQSGLPCSPCYVGGAFPGCGIGFACMAGASVDALRERLLRALDARASDVAP